MCKRGSRAASINQFDEVGIPKPAAAVRGARGSGLFTLLCELVCLYLYTLVSLSLCLLVCLHLCLFIVCCEPN